MILKQATYEVNGVDLIISRFEGHEIFLQIGSGNCKYPTHNEAACWMSANQILMNLHGARRKDKDMANVTNSEIWDFARVIGDIGGFE